MRRILAAVALLLLAMSAMADDPKPFPKPLKDGEKVKTEGWFGKAVLPKRHSSEIRMGAWKDGEQETWTPHDLGNCTVREERDGFLRVYDDRRETSCCERRTASNSEARRGYPGGEPSDDCFSVADEKGESPCD